MTLAKGKVSSRCKGNKIAADDPATKTTGEDSLLSKSKCSKEEEGSYDPDSECAPFINLWYDTLMHFLVVLDDYLTSSPGRVWLSICRRDTEVSWALFASSIPDHDIC